MTSVGVFDGVHLGHQSILERERGQRADGARGGAHGGDLRGAPQGGAPGPRAAHPDDPGAPAWRSCGARGHSPRGACSPSTRSSGTRRPEAFSERRARARARHAGVRPGLRQQVREGPIEVRPGVPGATAATRWRWRRRCMVGPAGGLQHGRSARRWSSATSRRRDCRMLGRPVTIYGEVVPRRRRWGGGSGFPTANLDLLHELQPPEGVYACRAHVVPPPSAASGAPDPRERVGSFDAASPTSGGVPTVAARGGWATLVEVHLLDFDGDLYGQRIELEFAERHARRGEVRRASTSCRRRSPPTWSWSASASPGADEATPVSRSCAASSRQQARPSSRPGPAADSAQ